MVKQPCPFCGSYDVETVMIHFDSKECDLQIKCKKCGCRGPIATLSSNIDTDTISENAHVWERWNTRNIIGQFKDGKPKFTHSKNCSNCEYHKNNVSYGNIRTDIFGIHYCSKHDQLVSSLTLCDDWVASHEYTMLEGNIKALEITREIELSKKVI